MKTIKAIAHTAFPLVLISLSLLFWRSANAACPYDPNCLDNPYGAGSPYKADGLMNPYSQYGSPYSNKSWTNPYATDAPRIYDSYGNYRGRFSTNRYDPDSISNPSSPYSNTFNNPYEELYIVPSR